ncbi:MAG: AAA family ATPase, partial [bacterium]|nr:AAA family ATPase [bacterium]
MSISVTISSINFNDGTRVSLDDNVIVVIVGANNAGKSQSLRDINQMITNSDLPKVVTDVALRKVGSEDEFMTWATERLLKTDTDNPHVHGLNASVARSTAIARWREPEKLRELANFFCVLADTTGRLSAANSAPTFNVLVDSPTNSIHLLYKDDALAKQISSQFRKAFGMDLVVNKGAGNIIPLHSGIAPVLLPSEDRVSTSYLERLSKLPLLQGQGDGMRSFVGCLLHATIGDRSIVLIDEPEAFLHPPQAKSLATMLAETKPEGRQLFIATHSGEILRGLLDAEHNLLIIRLKRTDDRNEASLLEAGKIQNLWKDPILRFSNIFDGLFHEQVIVCEGDADCRFYSAIADVLPCDDATSRRPDTMFTYGGGTGRIPLIVSALRALSVPVKVVIDFDVLGSEQNLKKIVESFGELWTDIEPDWRALKDAVESLAPPLTAIQVQQEINTI